MKKLLIFLFAILFTGCSIVGPGERGVRIVLGSVSEQPKLPGPYIWLPFLVGMAKVDVQIQKSEIKATAASKDMQEVTALVAVNWSINADSVVKTYTEVGNEYQVSKRILVPAVNEILKSSMAKRNAEELLSKRLETKKDIDEGLKDRLSQYGIILNDVSIVNLEFSRGFTEAIEHKQIAEQQSKQAEYVALKATQEAKAQVEIAKGQAESQRLLRDTITPALLQKMAIEKWNGSFPQFLGSGTLPFINLKSEKNKE